MTKEPGSLSQGPIVLFDGVCNLCNSSVQFVIRHDPSGQFSFAALQSAVGAEVAGKFSIRKDQMNSIVLLQGDQVYQKSDAVIEIARKLSGVWPAACILKCLPAFFRDWLYDRMAMNRYKWFGKRDECMIPGPELKSRFLS